MALHPDFPESSYTILNPDLCRISADASRHETTMDKLMSSLVSQLHHKEKDGRGSGYVGAIGTSNRLLTWGFNTPHLSPPLRGEVRGKVRPGESEARGEGLAEFQDSFACFLEDYNDVVSCAKNYLAVHFKMD
jgi:hypothetical protein